MGAGKDAPENPDELNYSNPDHNAHAYNNVYLDATQVDIAARETHAYIHWDYVKVGIIPFNIHVKKEWDDEKNNDGKREDSVTVHLYADGEDTGEALVLDESNGWEGEFPHVLRYDYDTKEDSYDGLDDGHYIEYSFVEDEIAGYESSISRNSDEVIVFNKHVSEKIDFPFEKIWEGDEDVLASRPTAIVVKLYADGVFTGNKQVVREDSDGTWHGVFTDLYKYNQGHEIVYSVEEERLDNYLTEYDGSTIKNIYYPYSDLQVTKELVDATTAAAENEFTFTLLLKDSEGNDLIDKYAYQILQKVVPEAESESEPSDSSDTDESGTDDSGTENAEEETWEVVSEGQIGHGDEFKLKGGQKIYVKDIPSHSVYTVSEARQAGFTKQVGAETGEIKTGIVSKVDYVNTYSSRGRAELKAWKKLIGRDLMKNQFKFDVDRILDDEGTKERVRSGSSQVDGSVVFGALNFTHLDDGKEFVYEIRERNEGKPGYTYDEQVITAKIVPHDMGDGTMTFDISYFNEAGDKLEITEVYVFADRFEMPKEEYEAIESEEERNVLIAEHQRPKDAAEDAAEDSGEGDDTENPDNPDNPDAGADELVAPKLVVRNEALFTNEYHAEGEIVLRAWKQLIGRTLENGEFTFELLSDEVDEENGGNVVLQTKTNNGQDIVFDAIQYDENDVGKTFYYFVREVQGDDDTVVYDPQVYGYSVYVVDNGDGTLSFSQKHVDVTAGIMTKDVDSPVLSTYYSTVGYYSYPKREDRIRNNFYLFYLNNVPELGSAMVDNGWFASEDVIKSTLQDDLVNVLSSRERALILRDVVSSNPVLQNRNVGRGDFLYITDTDLHMSYDSSFSYRDSDYFNSVPKAVGSDADLYQFLVNHPSGTYSYLDRIVGYPDNSEGELVNYVEIVTNYEVVYQANTSSNDIPVFINTLKPGSLTITKLTQWHDGDEPDPNQEFKFKIKLVNADGTPFEAPEDYEYIPEQVENIGELPATSSGGNQSDEGGQDDDTAGADSTETGETTGGSDNE